MLPLLMAAGRTLMGACRGGSSAKMLEGAGPRGAKELKEGGPRGANEFMESGTKEAGKTSPLDMMGNVANIASVGMQGFELFKGSGDNKPAPGTTSHYESVLN